MNSPTCVTTAVSPILWSLSSPFLIVDWLRVGKSSSHVDTSNEEAAATAAWSDTPPETISVTDPFLMVPPNVNDMETYRLFAQGMFDPSTFENLNYENLSGDGMSY